MTIFDTLRNVDTAYREVHGLPDLPEPHTLCRECGRAKGVNYDGCASCEAYRDHISDCCQDTPENDDE